MSIIKDKLSVPLAHSFHDLAVFFPLILFYFTVSIHCSSSYGTNIMDNFLNLNVSSFNIKHLSKFVQYKRHMTQQRKTHVSIIILLFSVTNLFSFFWLDMRKPKKDCIAETHYSNYPISYQISCVELFTPILCSIHSFILHGC